MNITELETINPDLELAVKYAVYDASGKIVSSGELRVDADVFNTKMTKTITDKDNELTYTFGKMLKGNVTIPITEKGAYGIKKISNQYPLEFKILSIQVLGNTYDHFIDSEINKCHATKRRPAIRHSDLITDPRYYYDRYPHQCEPLPSMANEYSPEAYMEPPMFPEMGRTKYIQDYDPRMDYIPGPLPMVDRYMPEPDPNHPMHPKNIPAGKKYPKPELRFDERFDPEPDMVSRYKRPRPKQNEYRYRRVGEYDCGRVVIFEQDGSELNYNSTFSQHVDKVSLEITIILDDFIQVADDREILEILNDNRPSTSIEPSKECSCDSNCAAHKPTHPQPPKPFKPKKPHRLFDDCVVSDGCLYVDKDDVPSDNGDTDDNTDNNVDSSVTDTTDENDELDTSLPEENTETDNTSSEDDFITGEEQIDD
jgi:hypothetical protein